MISRSSVRMRSKGPDLNKLRAQYMNRLFEVSPGISKRRRNPSTHKCNQKSNTKYESYKYLNSELITNHDSKYAFGYDSQQILKLGVPNESNDDKSLPKFKTLDGGSAELDHENIQKILNSNPGMKRSKTPSTYFKPNQFSSQMKNALEPINYYANISDIEPGMCAREGSSQVLIPHDPSCMVASKFSQFSSQGKIVSLKEAPKSKDKK